jgi:hypothetical protein
MFIIEKTDGSEVARHNNLLNINWPDGASSSWQWRAGDSRVGVDGETYLIKEVIQKASGEGPRRLSIGQVIKVDDEWHQITTYGPALVPPIPKPGDEGYNHSDLRREEFEKTMPSGDQLDAYAKWATAIRMKQSAIDTAIDSMAEVSQASRDALKAALAPIFDLPADLDTILAKWVAGKTKFPKE